jgi:hypothetical protein
MPVFDAGGLKRVGERNRLRSGILRRFPVELRISLREGANPHVHKNVDISRN